MKMTLAMDAARYVPGECNNQWKRDGDIVGGMELERAMGWEEAIMARGVDENGYPYLPANMVPW